MVHSSGKKGEAAASGLADAVIEAMVAAWKRGEHPRAEQYLRGTPLGREDQIRIIFEEACLRREAGEVGASSEILARFPDFGETLGLLLECDDLMRAAPAADFPEVGTDLGDFHLEAELGRGAIGRTYLARQHSLAGRAVVLKAAPLAHEEHLSLARLRHPYIVPLYFEQVLIERSLRVLGFPYLGGATLERLLADQELAATPPPRRTGRQLLDALDRLSRPLASEGVQHGPNRAFMAGASYVEVVVWIAACLADALAYAHERSLVHFDVKPSNVLLAGDGTPMLLDFHLAQGPVLGRGPAPVRLGGTVGRLAPEQERAMEAIKRGGMILAPVDGRADLYALGVLLHEALGGVISEPRADSERFADLRRLNPRVSVGLADIVARCLAHDPDDRYPEARVLAGDLKRHLSNQPLRGVSNRSVIESVGKWRRRSPGGLLRSVGRVVGAPLLLVAIVGVWLAIRNQDRQVDETLQNARRLVRRERYDEAQALLKQALAASAWIPGRDWRTTRIRNRLRALEHERAAGLLHEVVEPLRYHGGESEADARTLAPLLERASALWTRRAGFVDPTLDYPNPARETRVREDLLDLATIWADLSVRTASKAEASDALRRAIAILTEAERDYGASPALVRDLNRYLAAAGEKRMTSPRPLPPHSGWDHFDLGRSYLRSGELALAEASFRRAVELEPGRFWAQFHWGICCYKLGLNDDAASAMSACIALDPTSAECYFNRGRVHEARGRLERANVDYTRALELRPNFSDAALNRGLLALRMSKTNEALGDLNTALANAPNASTRALVSYNLALVHLKRGERTMAIGLLRQAAQAGNPDAQALARQYN